MSEILKKYPRTFHLPNSLGKSDDDKVLNSIEHFFGKNIIVTEKMDGECTTIYRDNIHARSLEKLNHPSHSWIKSFHAGIKYSIPENYRICGEYLYAKHSIEYNNLDSYFLAFSVWNGNTCLSWEDTVKFCEERGVKIVPVLFTGKFEEYQKLDYSFDEKKHEGYVIRLADEFTYDNFATAVAKFVRGEHVAINAEHWKSKELVINKLKNITERQYLVQ